LGSSLVFSHTDTTGTLYVGADYRKPFLEFVEGLLDGGTRDRVEIRREQRFKSAWIARAGAAGNRYGLKQQHNVASSLSFDAGLARIFEIDGQSLAFEYTIDAEYRRTPGVRSASAVALSLVDRQVHAASASGSVNFSSLAKLDSFAGFAVDRLGGRGPFYGGRFALLLPGGFETHAWFERRLNSVATGQVVNRYGAYFLRRFE
jgi:hypothetical protein